MSHRSKRRTQTRSLPAAQLLPAAWALLSAQPSPAVETAGRSSGATGGTTSPTNALPFNLDSLDSTFLYFAALFVCLAHVLMSWPWGKAATQYPLALLCVPFSCVSLMITWRLILLFIVEHYTTVCPRGTRLFLLLFSRMAARGDDPLVMLYRRVPGAQQVQDVGVSRLRLLLMHGL